jgi:hypothetical protein
MTPVAKAIGVNRIVVSPSIKYPFGAPHLSPEEERAARKEMLKAALQRLTQE